MSEAPKRLDDKVQVGVTNYVVRLVELMKLCADYVEKDPEIFLWNARRVLEVVFHILYSIDDNRVSRTEGESGNMVDRLNGLQKRKLVSPEYHTTFEAIRKHTNLGVHIRSPHREDYPVARKHVREQLPDVVCWLFEASMASHYISQPDDMELVMERIRGRQPAESTGSFVSTEVTVPTVQVPMAATPPRANRLPAVALGVLLGAGGLVGLRSLSSAVQAPKTPLAASFAPSPLAPPLASELATTCPNGMVLIDRTRLRLGPPEGGRKDWPQAAHSVLNEVEVESFCVDALATSWTQFSEWPASRGVDSGTCSWRSQDRDQPVGCLTREEASAYCEAKGWQLPSILEWEALMRSPAASAMPSTVREWVRDEFPPSALGFTPDPSQSGAVGLFRQRLKGKASPDGEPLNSWNRQELGNRYTNLGFRCAADTL